MRDLTGQTFGSYQMEELIGRGGMGEVYRARHLHLSGRLAAVKVLPATLLREPDFLRRFKQEANSAESLDHPNILRIWDYGEQDGIPYLAMPLVTGGSLRDLLEASGPLPPEQARRIVEELGNALDYAHKRGIIHRDVKPANVLLHDDGRPLLADFGIAKVIEGGQGSGLTGSGTIIGTPQYMAPEQARGRVDARSDLYALGIILYQMLTGQVPYDGDSIVEVLMKHQQETLPLLPFPRVSPQSSVAVTEVLQKALAKDPDQRYQKGWALAGAFSAALAPDAGATGRTTIVGQGGERTQVAPPSPRQPTAGSGATRLPLLIGGLVALVLLVGGIFALTQRGAEPTTTANAAGTSTAPIAAAGPAQAQTPSGTAPLATAGSSAATPAVAAVGTVSVSPSVQATTPPTATPTATVAPTAPPTPRPTPTATVAPTPTTRPTATPVPPTPMPTGPQLEVVTTSSTTRRPLTVTLVEAAREGAGARFTFVAVNAGPAYSGDICRHRACRVIDPTGQPYKVTRVEAGTEKDSFLAYQTIPSGAPYRFTLVVEGLPAGVQQVALVELNGLDAPEPMEFRNVPVPYAPAAGAAPPGANLTGVGHVPAHSRRQLGLLQW